MKPIQKLDLVFDENHGITKISTPIFEKINELIDAVNQIREPEKKTYPDWVNDLLNNPICSRKFKEIVDEVYNEMKEGKKDPINWNQVIEELKTKLERNSDEYKEKERTIQDLHTFEEENRKFELEFELKSREPEKPPLEKVWEECKQAIRNLQNLEEESHKTDSIVKAMQRWNEIEDLIKRIKN